MIRLASVYDTNDTEAISTTPPIQSQNEVDQPPKMPHFQTPEPALQPDPSTESSHQLQPQTRSPSQERALRIRVKNRRKLYLDRHPSYFASPDLELADPLLYDRCIRRFQTASEREADGKAKGYSGVLEADMYRTEAKIAALRPENSSQSPSSSRTRPPSEETAGFVPFVSYLRGVHGEVLPEEEDEVPKSKEEGFERWKFGMTVRFLAGDDEDFDYEAVDGSDELDEVERREREDSCRCWGSPLFHFERLKTLRSLVSSSPQKSLMKQLLIFPVT